MTEKIEKREYLSLKLMNVSHNINEILEKNINDELTIQQINELESVIKSINKKLSKYF